MVDLLIEQVLKFLSAFVGDKIGQDGAFRLLLLLVIISLLTYVSINWRGLLFRLPVVRRCWDFREKYCGSYIQPLCSDGPGLRYTRITISYDRRSGEYVVEGASYLPNGAFFASFESRYVVFPVPNVMEFIWSGREEPNPMAIGGFTHMRIESSSKGSPLIGRGYSVDFVTPARTNRLYIEQIKLPPDFSKYVIEFHKERGHEFVGSLCSNPAS